MDERELRAGLATIATRAQAPADAHDVIKRRAAHRVLRRRVATLGAAGAATILFGGVGVAVGGLGPPEPGPAPTVPADSPSPGGKISPNPDLQLPPAGPGEISCVYSDGTFAGGIDVDRTTNAPPLTKEQKDQSCATEWPGSYSG